MSINLNVSVKNNVSTTLKSIQQKLNNLPTEAYKVFRDITPVKTGYAKSQTKLKGTTIEANYNYASVLDKGRHMTNRGMRGSTQAPVGMTKPTLDFIRKRVKQIVKGR